jgi:cation transport ATPase
MAHSDTTNQLKQLLGRPRDQRRREYGYRCAQSLVFGVPVVALHYFGTSLGGPEAPRYVAVLQALLCGWVMYVGAAGMLAEGWLLLRARRRASVDGVVAVTAILVYILSLVAAVQILMARRHLPLFFHVSVLIVATWTGIRWAAGLYSVRHPDPSGE